MIFEANRDKIRNPDVLVEGTVLTIPPLTETAPAAPAGMQRYTVQRGDTLWSLAQRHYNDGNQWRRIAQANNMGENDRLNEGDVILIPVNNN